MLKKLKHLYPHQSLMSIFIIGLIIIASSLVVEHAFKVQPCEMCFWQRYLAIGITVVAFTGTLFRGRIKKWFLGTIALLAFVAMGIAVWQSLGQEGLIELPGVCQAPAVESTVTEGQDLLANLKEDKVDFVDCSEKENFFLYNIFGVTLANANAVLMLLIGTFAFYKLFFKPRRKFRRYNNKRYYRNNNRRNNNNRRHRGSGYRRAHNRKHRSNGSYNNRNER